MPTTTHRHYYMGLEYTFNSPSWLVYAFDTPPLALPGWPVTIWTRTATKWQR